MLTTDKTSKYDLSTLYKVTHPTVGTILKGKNQIASILANYPYDATESDAYGYAFLIYSNAVWLTKYGITTSVTVNKPVTFIGKLYTSC